MSFKRNMIQVLKQVEIYLQISFYMLSMLEKHYRDLFLSPIFTKFAHFQDCTPSLVWI